MENGFFHHERRVIAVEAVVETVTSWKLCEKIDF
ncbi:unnamed protein product [Nezara viridula]|uniref:Uncharacterized protein n=1 Tax=Nezara viridula TaxID=85310 RepID=A0A9P0HS82_NEZVI|nr:unnamed protein product [Nezara viridula]